MNVLTIDTSGTHVKILATREKTHREFPSGSTLTATRMVPAVKKLAGDWKYDVISIGYLWQPTSGLAAPSRQKQGIEFINS